MTAQTQNRPPANRAAWPVLRTPKWLLAGIALLAGLAIAVAWPTHPSAAQRAADLRAMVHDVTVDIESCAGGVTDTMTALRAIQAGTSTDVATAQNIASTAVNNCSPANNMQLDDLTQYQPTESLASFHLDTAVQDMVTWAFPLAQRVQADAGKLMAAHGAAAVAANAQLGKDQRAMDAERAVIYKLFDTASTALSAHVVPPPLPG